LDPLILTSPLSGRPPSMTNFSIADVPFGLMINGSTYWL
jgi:hypothetical protein